MRTSRTALALVVGLGLVAAGSPAQAAASPYHASVGITGLNLIHRATMGTTVTMSGKAWGGPIKNQKVEIWLSNGSAGRAFTRKLATAKIGAGNRFTYKWKTDDAGLMQLRVVKGASQGHKAVKVTSRQFALYRWADVRLEGRLIRRTSRSEARS